MRNIQSAHCVQVAIQPSRMPAASLGVKPHHMTLAFTVAELLAQGARQNQQEVCVSGWVWDRLEHRAIYDSPLTAPDPKKSVWVTGQLPNRPTNRGDGPLHGQWVQLTGVFHWQPKKGAGHFGLWPAWLGVKSVERTTVTTAECNTPNHESQP